MARDLQLALMLRVAVRHGYYPDGICDRLKLRAVGRTQEVLSCYGLFSRPVPAGQELWYGRENGIIRATGLPAAGCFSFAVTADQVPLTTITSPDWPVGQASDPACLFLSNREQAGEDSQILTSGMAEVLPLMGPVHVLRGALQEETPLVLKRWWDGAEVWADRVRGPEPWHLNFAGVAEGRHQLFAGGLLLLDFILSPNPRDGRVAQLEIGIGDGFRPDVQDVMIRFEARRTHLEYLVVPGNPKLPMTGAQILTGNGEDVFGAPQETVVRGRKAWRFRARSALPLALYPPSAQRLALHVPKWGARVFEPLPLRCPGPQDTRLGPGRDEAHSEVRLTV